MPDLILGPATRPSLLLRLRNSHDDASWQSFVEVYGQLVYRYCRRRGLQDADAADLMQEVLLQVSQSIAGFEYRPDRGRFRAWLATVTRNRLARFWKRSTRTSQLSPLHESDSPAESDPVWNEEVQRQLLLRALTRLRASFAESTWRAFELVWLEDLPAAEVARQLDLPIGQVYVAKSRVLKRLEQALAELAQDCSAATARANVT